MIYILIFANICYFFIENKFDLFAVSLYIIRFANLYDLCFPNRTLSKQIYPESTCTLFAKITIKTTWFSLWRSITKKDSPHVVECCIYIIESAIAH